MRGALVCQVSLEGLTRLLQDTRLGQRGCAYLVDHAGSIAAHPHLDLQAEEHEQYAAAAPVTNSRRFTPGLLDLDSLILFPPISLSAIWPFAD